VVGILVATASTAVAQPAPTEPEVKSEATAQLTAIGVTVVGVLGVGVSLKRNNAYLGFPALGLLAVGPSTGHLYAGETAHAVKMTFVRAAGLAAMFVGVGINSSPGTRDPGPGLSLFALGAGISLGSTLYDVIDARAAVRRHNSAWQVIPAPIATPTSVAPG